MKYRNGFVSNSSSSSFLICFPREPKSSQNIYDFLFPKNLYKIKCGDYIMNTEDIARIIYTDIQKAKEFDKKRINKDFRELVSYCFENDESLDMLNTINQVDPDFNFWGEKASKIRLHYFDDFIKENLESYMYLLTYSDETNEGFVMEHGDIFRNIPHARLNNH